MGPRRRWVASLVVEIDLNDQFRAERMSASIADVCQSGMLRFLIGRLVAFLPLSHNPVSFVRLSLSARLVVDPEDIAVGSRTQAARKGPTLAMPPTVRSAGVSYSSNTTPRSRSRDTVRSRSSASKAQIVLAGGVTLARATSAS